MVTARLLPSVGSSLKDPTRQLSTGNSDVQQGNSVQPSWGTHQTWCQQYPATKDGVTQNVRGRDTSIASEENENFCHFMKQQGGVKNNATVKHEPWKSSPLQSVTAHNTSRDSAKMEGDMGFQFMDQQKAIRGDGVGDKAHTLTPQTASKASSQTLSQSYRPISNTVFADSKPWANTYWGYQAGRHKGQDFLSFQKNKEVSSWETCQPVSEATGPLEKRSFTAVVYQNPSYVDSQQQESPGDCWPASGPSTAIPQEEEVFLERFSASTLRPLCHNSENLQHSSKNSPA